MDRYITPGSTLMDPQFDFDDPFTSASALLAPVMNSPAIIPNGQMDMGSTGLNPLDPSGSGSGSAVTPAQVIEAITRAPITDACRQRALGIVNDLISLKMPSTADGVWLQTLVAAAMGSGAYPPECVVSDASGSGGFPWWGYAAIGAGVCLVAYIALRPSNRKK